MQKGLSSVDQLQFSPPAQQWVNVVLLWIGFGTLTGLAARALIPGREPGMVGTLVIGVVGSVLGPLVLATVLRPESFNPISPLGLLTAIGGAALLLSAYRLLVVFVFRSRESASGE